MISPTSTPYHNLILTGYMGTGMLNVVRLISKQVGVAYVSLESEIQIRENMTADDIRQLYGESRVRTVENTLCREFSLQRGSVISVGGPTLLDEVNRTRLQDSGPILVLTCAINEILRRLYASQGARFHDPKVRSAALNQIRREQQIHQIKGLPTLDTTYLTVEQVVEQAVQFWYEWETIAV